MSDGTLRTHRVSGFRLECGAVLEEVTQAYRLGGNLNAGRDNLVVVFHALTGTPASFAGWDGSVVGPGLAIDTGRYAVVCANLLGSCYGTVADWHRTGEPAPPITPRDQARLIGALVGELGARSVALATGGSLGGMVALEWAALFPGRARAVVVFAAPAAHTAQAIGWNHVQRQAIRLGGDAGLAIARMVGMMTYRTADEFEARFGRGIGGGGEFEMRRYLSYQGEKLLARFDRESYLSLIGAMDAHDVGAGRGGVRAALRRFGGRLVGVGIPGDLLYTDADVRRWTEAAGAEYREIRSVHGHDAFLLELEQVAEILDDVLGGAVEPSLAEALSYSQADGHGGEG